MDFLQVFIIIYIIICLINHRKTLKRSSDYICAFHQYQPSFPLVFFVGKIGDKCTVDSDCQNAITGSSCVSGICNCTDGSYSDNDGTECTKCKLACSFANVLLLFSCFSFFFLNSIIT